MNILLINIPSRKGINGLSLPIALLSVASIIEREGSIARILDPYAEDFLLKDFDSGNFQNIERAVEDFAPQVIGFGGIATSYGRVKKLSQRLKQRFPGVLQIAGGPLSSVYELLLSRTFIDVVFHGEADISLPVFIRNSGNHWESVPGISYSCEGKLKKTPLPEQLVDLDSAPLPAYHLIDVHKYLRALSWWSKPYDLLVASNPNYYNLLKGDSGDSKFIEFVTSRGCTHACLFCYRHMKGVRKHSPQYVVDHMKLLIRNFGVKGFQFGDELFNSNAEWVFKFCDLLEEENLGIFYIVGGARVDKVDEKMLRRLKETGCVEVGYGQESGSDTILKEYRKGVTAEQNRRITNLTLSLGLTCPVQIVIGSPSESGYTIKETIEFLKSVGAYRYSLNYLIPLPATPIWDFVIKNNLVKDVEKYLDLVADRGGQPIINLTKYPDRVWRTWHAYVRKELELAFYRKTKRPLVLILKWLYFEGYLIFAYLLPLDAFIKLKSVIRKLGKIS